VEIMIATRTQRWQIVIALVFTIAAATAWGVHLHIRHLASQSILPVAGAGDSVLQAPWFAALAIPCLTVAIALGLSAIRPKAGAVTLLRGFAVAAGLIATFVALGNATLGTSGDDYYRFSWDDRRIIVSESSSLLAGFVDVYVRDSDGDYRHAASFYTDDGYRPVRLGTFTLEWLLDSVRVGINDGHGWRYEDIPTG
jgi:hypothetical protein